jgi:hypothetical protein
MMEVVSQIRVLNLRLLQHFVCNDRDQHLFARSLADQVLNQLQADKQIADFLEVLDLS